MIEPTLYNTVKDFIYSDAADALISHRLKDSITWLYYDYCRLKDLPKRHMHEDIDMKDHEESIRHLEHAYIFYSGDYKYHSVLDNELVQKPHDVYS